MVSKQNLNTAPASRGGQELKISHNTTKPIPEHPKNSLYATLLLLQSKDEFVELKMAFL
jgi:hypothetical protein